MTLHKLDYPNLVIENLPDLILLIDASNWEVCYINDRMAKSLGKNRAELVSKNILHYLPTKVAELRKTQGKKVIQTGKPVFFEDSREGRWFENSFYPVKNEKGIVQYGLVLVRDITSQKLESQQKLDQQKDFYLNLIKNTSDLIALFDGEGTITFISPSITEIFGYETKDLMYKKMDILLHPNEKKYVYKQLKKLVENKQDTMRIEHQILHKNGDWIYCETIGVNKLSSPLKSILINTRNISEKKRAEQLLQESEERYRGIVDNINDGIITLDLHGNFTYVNSIAAKRSGRSVKKMLTLNIYDLIMPEKLESAKNRFYKIISGKPQPPFELAYLSAEGKKIYIEVNARPIFENNKISSIHAVTRDITDRKKIEDQLKESEEKYRSIFNSSDVAIILTDMNGIVTDVNPAVLRILRYDDPTELIGRPTTESYAHPEKRVIVMEKLMENGNVLNHEMTFLRKDGTHAYCIGNGTVLRDTDGNIIGSIGSFNDITEKVNAERQIKRTKDYLQKVIDSTQDIIFSIDSDNRILTWNKAAERITGYKVKSIRGKKIDDIDIFIEPTLLKKMVQNSIQHKPLETNEISLCSIDGDHRLINISTALMNDEKLEINSILFTGHDITDESDLHKRLKFGNGYLIIDDRIEAQYIFENLLKEGVDGLHISRTPHHKKNFIQYTHNVHFAYLSNDLSNNDNGLAISSLDDLKTTIYSFIQKHRNSVVLIDRLDYLMTLNSFEEVLQAIYQIHDQTMMHHAIILLRISKNILSSTQQSLLYEELHHLPKADIGSIEIAENLFTILQFIKDRTEMNEQITFHTVEKSLHISKVTTRKRLLDLQSLGLVTLKKIGRIKTIKITYNGRILLQKRKTI